jgi:MATE family multidrug resistance protein
MFPFLGLVVLRSFLSAKGRTIWALYVSLLGVIANAVLNYGLVLGKFGFPQMGVVGAGIGSSLVNLAMFLVMVGIVTRHKDFRRYHLFGRFWRADWPRYRALVRLGLPIGLTMGFEASVFSAAVFLMGLISTESVAAHAVALQIASLTFMVPLGLAQATTVRVGLGHGRRDPVMIGRAGWTGFALGVGFMSLTALVIGLFPAVWVGLFVDPTAEGGPAVAHLAISFLMIAAIFQIVDGAQVMGAAMLRGLHDTRVPMVYAGIGYWGIGIGVGAFLAFRAGLDGLGIWIGLATGLAVVSLLMAWRWMRREKLGLVPLRSQ